jgi:hypothetical protein
MSSYFSVSASPFILFLYISPFLPHLVHIPIYFLMYLNDFLSFSLARPAAICISLSTFPSFSSVPIPPLVLTPLCFLLYLHDSLSALLSHLSLFYLVLASITFCTISNVCGRFNTKHFYFFTCTHS